MLMSPGEYRKFLLELPDRNLILLAKRYGIPPGQGKQGVIEAIIQHWKDKGGDKIMHQEDAVLNITIDNSNSISASARSILEEILPEWADHFLSKNRDYGDQHREIGLGEIGEFVGLWRKLWKLKRAIVEKQEMEHEDVDEMLYDLIGTAFLLLDVRRQDSSK